MCLSLRFQYSVKFATKLPEIRALGKGWRFRQDKNINVKKNYKLNKLFQKCFVFSKLWNLNAFHPITILEY